MKFARALIPLIVGSILLSQSAQADQGHPRTVNRVAYDRIAPGRIGLFTADSDGGRERPLLPAQGLDYDPSISADGTWVEFTSERDGSADIYRVHLDGTGLQRLTDSPAYDGQASLSPDGTTVAFVSTRDAGTANIWLLDLRSRHYRRLTTGTRGNFRPRWSPDGKWIAFTSDRDTPATHWYGGWELLQSTAVYLMRPDGTGLRRITELGGVAGSPGWSPDGEHILYYASTPQDTYPGRLANMVGLPYDRTGHATSQIMSVDVHTGVKQPLTSGPGLKLSPSYVRGHGLAYVIQSNTERHIDFLPTRPTAGIEVAHPSWSADGKTMVYQRTIPFHVPFVRRMFSIDPDFELYAVSAAFPAYSPSGTRLAMSRLQGDASGRRSDPSGAAISGELWVVDSDGNHPRRIVQVPGKMAFSPAWSPDGKSIAFGLGNYLQAGKGTFDGGKRMPSQIAVIDADGTNLRFLTDSDTNNGFPSWSPDGKRLVYRTDGNSGRGLRIQSVSTGRTSTLTTDSDNFPDWSPHGDHIMFTRTVNGRSALYSIDADGTHLRRLTDGEANDAHGTWSPDGRWIIFTSSRRGWKDEAMLGGTTAHEPEGPGAQPYGELFAMREDGSGLRQLTDDQWESALASWMPDPAG